MQPTTLFFALSGLAFACALPQSLNTRSPEETLYVTFWRNGCGPTNSGDSSTAYVNESDEGVNRPGDCVLNFNYDFQSVQVRQPQDESKRYSIDLFSGEGCNNPILTVNPEDADRCYTQPEGQMVASFRAHLV